MSDDATQRQIDPAWEHTTLDQQQKMAILEACVRLRQADEAFQAAMRDERRLRGLQREAAGRAREASAQVEALQQRLCEVAKGFEYDCVNDRFTPVDFSKGQQV